jgi:tetratricopeptide (TPR) repeat protein
MSAHPIPAISSEESSEESSHQLDLRLLKFRNRPEREDPSMLALALVGAGRAHDAIEVIDAALTADPDDADLLVSCGLAATRSGQLAFAQLVLTRAAKVAPDWAEPIRGLVAVLELRGQKDRALAVARHAIRVGASDAALAEMIRKDDRRRALDARIAALRADADAEDAALLGQELLAEDRAGDALEVATMHIGSGPIDADLAMVQARAHLARNDRDRACDALARALEAAPDWSEPAAMHAELRLDEGALEAARGLVERALVAAPEQSDLATLHERIAQAMREAGIERARAADVALDRLIGTLETIDPIGDETRRILEHGARAGKEEEAPKRPRRRPGWLPSFAKTLVGAVAPPLGAGGGRRRAPSPPC